MKRHEKQIYPLYSFVFYQRRIGEAARNEKANEIIKHLKGLSADSPFYIDKGAWIMEILANIAENPENVTFATLFIGLLVWVMRANTDRENRYMQIISDLTESLKSLDLIEKTVNEIKSKIER